MSKKGKCSVQNWQSDPMNSPKAFGELKIEYFRHNRLVSKNSKILPVNFKIVDLKSILDN